MKRVFKRSCYGIADHLADAAPADQTGDSKQYGDQYITLFLSEFIFEIMMDIVRRTATITSIEGILLLMKLREGCLDERS